MNPKTSSFQSETPPLFTAAQIARAVGVSRQGAYKLIGESRASGEVVECGRPVKGWRMEALPHGLRERLAEIAKAGGYRNEFSLLMAPPVVWKPASPLSAYGQEQIARAGKLRKAFARTLGELNDPGITPEESARRGLADYRREFGYDISGRHWDRLLMRTVRRDSGAGDWSRLELYLDEKAEGDGEKTAGQDGVVKKDAKDAHDELLGYIAECRLRGLPEAKMRDALWVKVLDHVEAELESGREESLVRNGVLQFLWEEAGFMARSEKALREQFRVKWQQWETSGGKPSAIQDKRGARSGNFRSVKLTDEDRKQLIAKTLQYGPGGLSMAFRECLRLQLLSPAVSAYYDVNWNRKSHVPRAIREAIRDDVRILKPWHHGPHAGKMAGAYTVRDPNTFHAGDWFQADDLTAPVYYYDEGNPFNVIRGQTLLMIDCRSWCILGFVLIPLPQYTSFDIRNLISSVYDAFGLPRKGFYFERGIWKQSRLVTGRQDDVQWGETELGLREFVRFRHAREARSKVIERVLGLIQNHMGGERGYAGRDERAAGFERIKDQIAAVRAMKYHAGEYFLSKSEWCERLRDIIDLFNAEKQNGEYLPGISPLDGFERFFGNVPLTRLPDNCRYLLANHKFPVTVGRNGVSFTLAGRRWNYKGENTGALMGRQVKVWFNPESPETVSLTDFDNRYFCTVPLAPIVPAMDATPEQLAAAERANNAHNAYGKRLFETIRPVLFSEQFRRRMFKPSIIDSATKILGARMDENREAVVEQVREMETLDRKNKRLSRKLHLPPARTPTQLSPAAMEEALKGKEALLRLFQDGEGSGAETLEEALRDKA